MALKDLIKSTDDIENTLENLLKGRVSLIKTGEERSIKLAKDLYKKLDNSTKILLYLAGKLAWGIIDGTEYCIRSRELEKELSISGGSVRPTIMKLKQEKSVVFDKKAKGYKVTPLGILELENLLQKYEKK